jgi:putative ABC transport system ATP-binding protein
MKTPAIYLENTHLSYNNNYGKINILKGINLQILSGEAVALVGPSGSGKSSLLMVIAGLEQASEGKIKIFDKDITQMNENQLALFRGKSMGVIFQSFHLIPTMTSLENVTTPLDIQGYEGANKKALEVLELVGLLDKRNNYPAQLSGGEQQRVALARAVVGNPKILLADEPTGNLDSQSGELVSKMLFDLKDNFGATLLIVTHSDSLADKCDRQIFLKDGLVE